MSFPFGKEHALEHTVHFALCPVRNTKSLEYRSKPYYVTARARSFSFNLAVTFRLEQPCFGDFEGFCTRAD